MVCAVICGVGWRRVVVCVVLYGARRSLVMTRSATRNHAYVEPCRHILDKRYRNTKLARQNSRLQCCPISCLAAAFLRQNHWWLGLPATYRQPGGATPRPTDGPEAQQGGKGNISGAGDPSDDPSRRAAFYFFIYRLRSGAELQDCLRDGDRPETVASSCTEPVKCADHSAVLGDESESEKVCLSSKIACSNFTEMV